MDKSKLPSSIVVRKKRFILVFLVVILTMMLAACSKDTQNAKTGSDISATNINKLTFVNDAVSYDGLKQDLTNNRAINQTFYTLYGAGSIALQEDGSFTFSGSGPGYSIKSSGQSSSEITENPMSIQLTGKIDRQALATAIKEGKKVAVKIGSGSYKYSTGGTKKYLFARGNYELTQYSEEATCPLEIVYVSDSGRIICQSKDDFEAPKIGKTTSVYDGSTSESDYHENKKTSVRFEFIPK